MNVTLDISPEELVEVAQLIARLRKDTEVCALSPELNKEEKAFVLAGNKIDAIKAVRARLGCSLVGAKDIVEGVKRP